jgi:hypothetical protein
MTYKDLHEKRNFLLTVLKGMDETQMSKLKYFILKWNKDVESKLSKVHSLYLKKYENKKEELEIFYASEDEKGFLIIKDDKCVYTKDNSIKLKSKLNALKEELDTELQNEIIDFEPQLFEDTEQIFDEYITEELKGIFIK